MADSKPSLADAETETRIEDCDLTKVLRWRTVYLPEETAIDYFYSEFTETTIP